MTSSPSNFSPEMSAAPAGPAGADPEIQALLETLAGGVAGGVEPAAPSTPFAVLLAGPAVKAVTVKAPGAPLAAVAATDAPPANSVACTIRAFAFEGVSVVGSGAEMPATDPLVATESPVDPLAPGVEPPRAVAGRPAANATRPESRRLGPESIDEIATVIASLLQTLPREPAISPVPSPSSDVPAPDASPSMGEAGNPDVGDGANNLPGPATVTVRIGGPTGAVLTLPVAAETAPSAPSPTVRGTSFPPSFVTGDRTAAPVAADPDWVETIKTQLASALATPETDEPVNNDPVAESEATSVDATRMNYRAPAVRRPAPAAITRPVADAPVSLPVEPTDEASPPPAAALESGETVSRPPVRGAVTVAFATDEGVEVAVEFAPASAAAPAATPGAARRDVRDDTRRESREPENIAASARAAGRAPTVDRKGEQKTFLIAEDRTVSRAAKRDGIRVAFLDANMPAAIADHRALEKPELPPVASARLDLLPVHAGRFETVGETEAPPAPVDQAFVRRAIETVTTVADAQFAATLHRTSSVNLRLKFAGEDLSVRVEMRDGAVQTDFRTDSAELRAALQHEWQAVAAENPAQKLRYLDPLFSPASNHQGLAGGQDQYSRHQPPARSPESQPDFPFAVRPSRAIADDPVGSTDAAARIPLVPPTAIRLSARA